LSPVKVPTPDEVARTTPEPGPGSRSRSRARQRWPSAPTNHKNTRVLY